MVFMPYSKSNFSIIFCKDIIGVAPSLAETYAPIAFAKARSSLGDFWFMRL